MCRTYDNCYDCPLSTSADDCLFTTMDKGNENVVVDRAEKWAKEHPIKTRQSEFLKMFPNARTSDGVLSVRPCDVNYAYKCNRYDDCGNKCRRDYWLQEVE